MPGGFTLKPALTLIREGDGSGRPDPLVTKNKLTLKESSRPRLKSTKNQKWTKKTQKTYPWYKRLPLVIQEGVHHGYNTRNATQLCVLWRYRWYNLEQNKNFHHTIKDLMSRLKRELDGVISHVKRMRNEINKKQR